MQANTLVLSTNYLPILNADFLYRDEDYNKFIEALVDTHHNLWVDGGRGVGKTTLFKQIIEYLTSNGEAYALHIHMNSRTSKTIKDLARMFQVTTFKGVSEIELGHRIAKEAGDKKVVIIFDEIERLYETKRYNSSIWAFDDLLHGLWNVFYEDMRRPIQFVLVGTTPPTLQQKFFTPTSLSRFQWKWHAMRKYNADEILQILKHRMDKVLLPTTEPIPYNLQNIAKLAELTFQRWGGDIRQALDTLIDAVKLAETEVDGVAIDGAIEIHKRGWWKERLLELGWHAGFFLYMSACMKKAKTETIRHVYLDRCRREEIDALSRAHSYTIYDKLLLKGYVEMWTEQITMQRKGQSKRVWVNMPDDDDRRRIIEAGTSIYGPYNQTINELV